MYVYGSIDIIYVKILLKVLWWKLKLVHSIVQLMCTLAHLYVYSLALLIINVWFKNNCTKDYEDILKYIILF